MNQSIDHRMPRPLARQRGSVLLLGLILMLLATLLAVTVLQSGLLHSKAVTAERDRERAFQAAETSLRFAEAWLQSQAVSPNIGAACPMTGDCAAAVAVWDGRSDSPAPPAWQGDSWQLDLKDWTWWTANGRQYAWHYEASSGLPQLPAVAVQPRYLVQLHQYAPDDLSEPSGSGRWLYRITATAYGQDVSSHTVLESTYVRRFD